MKVALLAGQFPALSETFILNQVTGLLDRDVEVDIFAWNRPRPSKVHEDVERYGLLKRTTYADATAHRRPARRLRKLALGARAAARSWRAPGRFPSMVRHLREDAEMALSFAYCPPRRYDVLLAHFGPEGQRGLALRSMGIVQGPLVTTFHGYDMSRYLRGVGEGVYGRLFREGDLFLPISDFWRNRLVELGCPSDRIRVHRMGVETDRFAFRSRTPPDDAVRILTVGRLVEKKGVEYGIRAVARLLEDRPELRYTIVGDGPLREDLERVVDELGVGDAIRLAGAMRREEVMDEMARAHVLLAPSVTSSEGGMEGIPVVLMEAMASGLPVLSTRHSGIPELVEDGITGFLVPERDVDALHSALRQVLEGPGAVADIQKAARRRVEDQFDVHRLNDQLVRLFQDLG